MMNTLVVIRRNIAAAAVAALIDLRGMPVVGCLAAAAVIIYAAAPDWWISRSLTKPGITVNDSAVANQGQLKNFAKAAPDEKNNDRHVLLPFLGLDPTLASMAAAPKPRGRATTIHLSAKP